MGRKGCGVVLLSCVADMSNTFRLIICVVVVSFNEKTVTVSSTP